MRKVFAAGLLGLALTVAACAPTKPPPPPPPPTLPNADVLMLGDSIGYGVGCILGHNGGTIESCPAQPGFTTFNAYRGACAISQGWTLGHHQFALEGPCNDAGDPNDTDYTQIWPAAVAAVDPALVVIVTGGWEIVDHWDESFPTAPGCAPNTPNATLNCAQTDWQWGSTNPALEAGAIENYSSNLENAIGLIRDRPDPPKVLVLTMPYVDPNLQAFGSWYESYDATKPDDYVLPNTATPYKSSRDKVDSFNATIAATVDGLGLPADVQWFNFWDIVTPLDTAGGQRVFSMYVCTADPAAPLDTCPLGNQQTLIRNGDRSHMSLGGNQLLGQHLIPEVREMLGLPPLP